MNRTPEEIAKAMKLCRYVECTSEDRSCPYEGEADCMDKAHDDAMEMIKALWVTNRALREELWANGAEVPEADQAAKEQLEKALQTELATTVGIKPKPDTLCPANAEHDPVNHPSHYTQGGVECKDAIRAAVTGLAGYEAFLTGNAIKYLWRWKRKNGAEDLRKAAFWIRELIDKTEARDDG